MPAGLQIFSQDGSRVMLTLTDSITRYVGTFNTGTNDGSLNLGWEGRIWYCVLAPGGWYQKTPDFTLNGGTISWTFTSPGSSHSGDKTAVNVIWGYY